MKIDKSLIPPDTQEHAIVAKATLYGELDSNYSSIAHISLPTIRQLLQPGYVLSAQASAVTYLTWVGAADQEALKLQGTAPLNLLNLEETITPTIGVLPSRILEQELRAFIPLKYELHNQYKIGEPKVIVSITDPHFFKEEKKREYFTTEIAVHGIGQRPFEPRRVWEPFIKICKLYERK